MRKWYQVPMASHMNLSILAHLESERGSESTHPFDTLPRPQRASSCVPSALSSSARVLLPDRCSPPFIQRLPPWQLILLDEVLARDRPRRRLWDGDGWGRLLLFLGEETHGGPLMVGDIRVRGVGMGEGMEWEMGGRRRPTKARAVSTID